MEMLQAIWIRLPLIDLIHCQRVCELWRAGLPGDRAALRRSLYGQKYDRKYDDGGYIGVRPDLKQTLALCEGNIPQMKFVLTAHRCDP